MDRPGILLFTLRQPTQEATRDSCTGKAVENAFKSLSPSMINMADRIISRIFETDMCEDFANEFCQTTIVPPSNCNSHSQYRTTDGTCNNLINTDWGKSSRRLGRFIPPIYEDVVGELRLTGTSGNRLPNARDVSLSLHTSSGNERESQISLFVMQWGQFLDHDLIHIPEEEKSRGVPFDCCGVDRGHPLCAPIDTLNRQDTVSRENNRNCIQFARSVTAPITSCQFIFREQSNQITSYIDGSQIYGSNEEENDDLRGEGGKLRTYEDSKPPITRSHCPISTSTQLLPAIENERGFDFEAGDQRVTEQPGLASIHTLFLRVHNTIVDMLKQINPYWDDDRLYQETRRIVGALLQHITYNEWLPIVLGPDLMRTLGLDSTGSYSQYNPRVDATIMNSFGTAAFRRDTAQSQDSIYDKAVIVTTSASWLECPFVSLLYRFGHSLVAGVLMGEGQNLFLGDNFFNGRSVCTRPTRVSALLRGLAASPANRYDNFLDPALTNLLFRENENIGLDLAALNIQRGRDHGLPGYNTWRRACFGQGFNSFDELRASNVMNPEVVDRLSRIYASVDDIDLFPGGLSETRIPGGLVGPVFACIIADQFNKLKFGDRFFFQHGGQPGSFPEGQLNAIRSMSLASILCQFSDTQAIQPQVFFQHQLQGNAPQPCSQFPRLDLRQWVDMSTGPYGPLTTPPSTIYGPPPTTGHTPSQLEIERARLLLHRMLPQQIYINKSPKLPFKISRGVQAPYG
ncbi:salivary peroxidase/catechol oxidase-like [Oratosquilla oratoria]|uniref:salivary peroxidase/catechol oxidase-like n=1 Tax=Oratosquilla oratoria TaxID=337810 RepID=UPI003F762ABC